MRSTPRLRPLLNRLGHRNELTAAGEMTYRRALVLLAEHNDLVAEINDLRGLKRGVLRIGLPPVGCAYCSPRCSRPTAAAPSRCATGIRASL